MLHCGAGAQGLNTEASSWGPTKDSDHSDSDAIFCHACQQDKLLYQTSHIMTFPDYTKLVQQQHQSFTAAKQHLRNLKLQYMLLYQARLKVIFNEKTHIFKTSEKDATTEDGVEARGKKLSRGLKLRLTPRRRRRECTESHPDQQRTGGRWGDKERWYGSGAPPPLSQQDVNTGEGAEACGRRLSRGLRLQLDPGRQCRGSAGAPRPATNQRQGLTA
ncbi:hypothetical protein NDU88_004135 [Pleurodeles waltl]|uniref:Uncharacterized protein n=1 Tax=Pleurodeles waltl TaxID=8319 RepID=A0AAV7RKG1_PLEWA|nr:hypothetical protein NDU88_004135 [Pleurodeles waltl]